MKTGITYCLIMMITACGRFADEGDDGGTADDSGTAGVCEFEDLTQCGAPLLCGVVDIADRPSDGDPNAYADNEVCAMTALRDKTPGMLRFTDCVGSVCEDTTLIVLADGRVVGEYASYDAELGSSVDGRPLLCTIPEPAFFADCLAAFDAGCNWTHFSECPVGEPVCACP